MWEKIRLFTDEDLKATLGALWISIERGSILRDDRYGAPYNVIENEILVVKNDSPYLIADWEQGLVTECERRGIPLSVVREEAQSWQ